MTERTFRDLLAIVDDRILVDQLLPDGWTARFQYAIVGAGLRLSRIDLTPGDGGVPISTTSIRQISPAAAEREALRRARENPTVLRVVDVAFGRERWASLARPTEARARLSDLELAMIALEYLLAIGDGPAPRERVAERLGIPSGHVREHLRRARNRGLLTSPGPGRAGGALTPKAIELVNGYPARLLGRLAAEPPPTNQED